MNSKAAGSACQNAGASNYEGRDGDLVRPFAALPWARRTKFGRFRNASAVAHDTRAAPMNGDLRESPRLPPYRGLFRARMIAALSSPPYTKIAAIEYRKTSAAIAEASPA